jgi:hypothetical protein
MQDLFTGKPTCIRGRTLPDVRERAALQDDHERRLAALARLSAAAARVGIGTDPDDDLALFADDELSLLQGADELWGELAASVSAFRALTPIYPLELFGFPADSEDPLGDGSPRLHRIGSGVEAWAFVAEDGSVYKFYLPREGGRIGGSFAFRRGEDVVIEADANLGTYRGLFEKLLIINALDGMPTELVGLSPEGVVIAKQTLGERLADGIDVTPLLPKALIGIPARFLRAHRDHPRLFFARGKTWFVADTHERNLATDREGRIRAIDLLAAPWPEHVAATEPLVVEWIARARVDPAAPLLRPVNDDEL